MSEIVIQNTAENLRNNLRRNRSYASEFSDADNYITGLRDSLIGNLNESVESSMLNVFSDSNTYLKKFKQAGVAVREIVKERTYRNPEYMSQYAGDVVAMMLNKNPDNYINDDILNNDSIFRAVLVDVYTRLDAMDRRESILNKYKESGFIIEEEVYELAASEYAINRNFFDVDKKGNAKMTIQIPVANYLSNNDRQKELLDDPEFIEFYEAIHIGVDLKGADNNNDDVNHNFKIIAKANQDARVAINKRRQKLKVKPPIPTKNTIEIKKREKALLENFRLTRGEVVNVIEVQMRNDLNERRKSQSQGEMDFSKVGILTLGRYIQRLRGEYESVLNSQDGFKKYKEAIKKYAREKQLPAFVSSVEGTKRVDINADDKKYYRLKEFYEGIGVDKKIIKKERYIVVEDRVENDNTKKKEKKYYMVNTNDSENKVVEVSRDAIQLVEYLEKKVPNVWNEYELNLENLEIIVKNMRMIEDENGKVPAERIAEFVGYFKKGEFNEMAIRIMKRFAEQQSNIEVAKKQALQAEETNPQIIRKNIYYEQYKKRFEKEEKKPGYIEFALIVDRVIEFNGNNRKLLFRIIEPYMKKHPDNITKMMELIDKIKEEDLPNIGAIIYDENKNIPVPVLQSKIDAVINYMQAQGINNPKMENVMKIIENRYKKKK